MAGRRPLLEIEGQRELRRTLKAAGDDLSDLKAAHKEAAEIASDGSEPLAPRLSGKLAGSIRAGATKTQAVIRAGRKSVPYAGPIHWGWKARGIEPHAFLADGAKRTESQWIPIFEKVLQESIKKVKGK